MAESLFLRLLPYNDKALALSEAVAAVRAGRTLNPVVHAVDPTSFRQVPGSPFAYWVSERIRRLFTELPPFESEGRTVKQGLATADDFRFVRTWWEVSPEKILTGTAQTAPEEFRKKTFAGKRWVPFAKGGEYSPYYADLHLVVDWERDGEEIRNFIDPQTRRPYSRPQNTDFYFHPGLTWPLRTNGLSFRALVAGCVFGHKGPAAFAPDDSQESLLALATLMNSQGFYLLVYLLVARVSLAQSFEVGLIQSIPISDISRPDRTRLGKLAHLCLDAKRDLDRSNETSHVFHLPALLQVGANSIRQAHDRLVFAQSVEARRSQGSPLQECIAAWQAGVTETERQLAEYQREIDDIAFRLYGIEDEDRQAIEAVTSGKVVTSDKWVVTSEEGNEVDSEEDQEPQALATGHSSLFTADHSSLVTDLLSYALGCAFGRWDIRFATGELPAPELPDPFVPLPAYSPGMLVPTLVTIH